MKTELNLNGKYKLAYCKNEEIISKNIDIKSGKDVKKFGLKEIEGIVPGNFELDLQRLGIIDEPFYSTNTVELKKYEYYHSFYYTTFKGVKSKDELYLKFEGIDTVAEIYLNGKLLGKVDNCFIEHEFLLDDLKEENELLVHILPAVLEVRKYENSLLVKKDRVFLRKPASSFGWDIMPRTVSMGIFRPVSIISKPKERFEEAYLFTKKLVKETGETHNVLYYRLKLNRDEIEPLKLRLEIKGEETFVEEYDLHYQSFGFDVKGKFKLWWPRNMGEQNLYEVTVKLMEGSKVLDEKKFNYGFRTVELLRSSTVDDGNLFKFKINDVDTFFMGSNWVPLDAYHSRDDERLDKAVELLYDIGCNSVRCWGGNLYESERFFDYMDEKGIMVWQDFMMACAYCPQDEDFYKKIKTEAEFIVKKLRSHPSLVLWAGDNEVDSGIMDWIAGGNLNPNDNKITRNVLKEVVALNDYCRPYLPSSPYIDEVAYKTRANTPEDHLWGPRDYFKGDYYKNAKPCFVSETGYHGCPSVESLKKYIREENLYPMLGADGEPNEDYLIHGSSLYSKDENSYRTKLMISQVETLFGEVPDTLEEFSLLSQISEAEADKYFIERMRAHKKEKGGIIWWNILDGWPQISDAVVDYYYDKKKAYEYIKRCQTPLWLMVDEPINGKLSLCYANDKNYGEEVEYEIFDARTDKKLGGGKFYAEENYGGVVKKITCPKAHECLIIKWTASGKEYINHYFTDIKGINKNDYLTLIKKAEIKL